MRKFTINLLLFAGLLILIDLAAGRVLRLFYFRQVSGLEYRTTYSMEKSKADILVFGTSRANHHYVPQVFENAFHQSFYNTGRDGESILYEYAVLKSALTRYTPKVIILDLLINEFDYDQDSYDRLSCLLPYYRSHPEIRDVVDKMGPLEKYKLYSSIYPYNSSVLTIIMGNRKNDGEKELKGYIPLSGASKVRIDTVRIEPRPLDSMKIQVFKNFIKECQVRGIRLFVVVSPELAPLNNFRSIEIGQTVASQCGVPFFNYVQDSCFTGKPKLFYDRTHLNDSGARLFCTRLVNDLQQSGATGTGVAAHL